jgi:spermidine synthase
MNIPLSLSRLSNLDGRLLYAGDSHGRTIEVREQGDLRWLHFGGHAIQALMRLDRPDELLLPYNIAMLGALLFVDTPRRLLNLGLGSGSFERFFRARMPGLSVTSVESNAAVVDLARQYFFIPQQQAVFIQSADDFLTRHKKTYDLIFCDVFEGDQHPVFMKQAVFYESLSKCLQKDGVVAINLLPKNDTELLNILLAIRRHFAWVWLMEFPDHRNIVLFLMNHEPVGKNELELRAAELGRSLGVDLSDLPRRLLRLPEREVVED